MGRFSLLDGAEAASATRRHSDALTSGDGHIPQAVMDCGRDLFEPLMMIDESLNAVQNLGTRAGRSVPERPRVLFVLRTFFRPCYYCLSAARAALGGGRFNATWQP